MVKYPAFEVAIFRNIGCNIFKLVLKVLQILIFNSKSEKDAAHLKKCILFFDILNLQKTFVHLAKHFSLLPVVKMF